MVGTLTFLALVFLLYRLAAALLPDPNCDCSWHRRNDYRRP